MQASFVSIDQLKEPGDLKIWEHVNIYFAFISKISKIFPWTQIFTHTISTCKLLKIYILMYIYSFMVVILAATPPDLIQHSILNLMWHRVFFLHTSINRLNLYLISYIEVGGKVKVVK